MKKLKGATVLLTGGRGFLGTFVKAMLEQDGAKVYPVGRRDGYDLRNEAEALSAALLTKPGLVVHLAVQKGAPQAGGALFKDNLQMGANVIHAAALAKASLIVVSDRQFGLEDCPVGIAKQTLHRMCMHYRRQYGLKAATLVAPDLYGVGEEPHGVVHTLTAAMCESRHTAGKPPVKAPYAADQKVCILHAFDAASAILKACSVELDDYAPIWLAPHGPELDYGTLLKKLATATGYTGEVEWPKLRDGLPVSCGVEPRGALTWEPQVSIDEGIAEELSWFSPKQEAKA